MPQVRPGEDWPGPPGSFARSAGWRAARGAARWRRVRSIGRTCSVTLGPASSSILATLAQTLGRVPQVSLRGTEPGCGPPPPTPSGMPEPADHDRALRLRLFGVIGHGGMGVVLKGYDADLGRDLAVKVLREQFRDQPEMVRRFIEEAQIGGQLQHPGVVPVYELGSLCRSPALHRHEVDPRPDPGRGARRAPRAGRRSRAAAGNLRIGLPDHGLRARPRRHPPRLEAVEYHGGQLRRGAGDGLGPGQGLDPGCCAGGGGGAGCPGRVAGVDGGHGAERGRRRAVAAGERAGDPGLHGTRAGARRGRLAG